MSNQQGTKLTKLHAGMAPHIQTSARGPRPRAIDAAKRTKESRVREGITSEALYHRDDALLYIAYVMLIWAAPIPADRCHCSLWP